MVPDLAERMAAITSLTEPMRRALYLYVAAQHRPVSRAEAAAAQGVPRTVAAVHPDKPAHTDGRGGRVPRIAPAVVLRVEENLAAADICAAPISGSGFTTYRSKSGIH